MCKKKYEVKEFSLQDDQDINFERGSPTVAVGKRTWQDRGEIWQDMSNPAKK